MPHLLRIVILVLLMGVTNASAQIFTLTNTSTGNNNIALGYTVPLPVDSLTPIDGFRSYNSLHLRHLQMAESRDFINQSQVGSTLNNRPIYAYTVGDDDLTRVSGGDEGSVLINGTIHAREWQSPEAVTGFIEYLYDNHDDQHLAAYIIDNLNFVVLPVLNIDGFLQTQRFANQVTASRDAPRDGRLRRKNMRNVDTNLSTVSDNLNGVDLNRNNGPFWASSTGSSSDPQNIVHHGSSQASEPETKALQQAAVLAGESRLRLYIDTHSFTQIYFSRYIDNQRRNDLNDRLATIMRAANNNKYRYDPSPAGSGIGSTDEYFANQYQALSYTLETEPLGSAQEYGGFGVSHDGFILPNSEVRRMVTETSNATIAGLYAISDIPFLESAEVREKDTRNVVFDASYLPNGTRRDLTIATNISLEAGKTYVISLSFNKPMRKIENGQVVNFGSLINGGKPTVSLRGVVSGDDILYTSSVNDGQWQIDDGYKRYKTDTYTTEITMPSDFSVGAFTKLAIEVETQDITGFALDADPSTIVGWQAGSWTNYENRFGVTHTNEGGKTASMRLIDDQSSIFDVEQPVFLPTPPPDNQNGSGGGSINLALLFLMLLVAHARFKTIFVAPRQ